MQSSSESPGADPTRQRYQIAKKIDAGGMAEIFLAKAMSIQGMEKLVAIKRVLPSLTKNQKFISMFLDEARLSISLNHANIVQVFDVNQSGGTYFIVMEYVDGFNLRRVFQKASEIGYRMPLAFVAYMMMEVCKGLEHAHTKKDSAGKPLRIVHRDLSPPNVLVSKSGEVKITDFGLAKATSQLTKTDPGIVKGKYSYLSPEVTEGKAADHRADLFAAGIVTWELLANRRLFLAKTDVETVELVRKAEVPPLSKFNKDVTPEFERIVMRALARDPKKRFTSAREMGDAFADYLFKNGLKTTSYDLAQMVDHLFGANVPHEDATERHQRIASLIDEEIANLSMLGFSPAVRGMTGAQPIDPSSLAFPGSPRFDLSGVWTGSGPVRATESDNGQRSPSLRALEEVKTAAELVSQLEGDSTGSVDWPSTTASSGGSKTMVWVLAALVVVGTAVGLFFALQ
ncbi:MAG: serine/threonine protein kinase [Deltaproteobacteria bacterium]|nr:MAG: serine/threonine protein kinase [Deltaproteobacteria bacterium]